MKLVHVGLSGWTRAALRHMAPGAMREDVEGNAMPALLPVELRRAGTRRAGHAGQ